MKAMASAPICFERCRNLAGAAGDARVVEQDHLAVASQAIRHRRDPNNPWLPMKCWLKTRGTPSGLAEAAISEANAVGLNELCRLSSAV